MAVAMSPLYRDTAIVDVQSAEIDVLVIGGGIVGAGAALDAATRGLATAIVEARDWASGTSSRSSKLIHGGLRYLEMLDFGLVREALRERELLSTTIAPHLIRPVPFLYPLTHRGWERAYVGAGVLLYDALGAALGASRSLPRHRHLSKKNALRNAPCLNPRAVTGAVQYWDAQVDDARYTLAVVRTAVSHGVKAINRARAVGLLREGDTVVGALIKDLETGDTFPVRCKQVVNATGVWTNRTGRLAGLDGPFTVRASKGIHLVVPRDRIESTTGLILRAAASVLFVIPWGAQWIVGTTDTAWPHDLDHPAATAADINYLLGQVNSVLARPLSHADVQGVYVGLRPLLSGVAEQTTQLSREHTVGRPAPGLVVVAGGKYTTYRVMAADAVDEAAQGLGEGIPASCTSRIPLIGAHDWPGTWNQRATLARDAGLNSAEIDRLLGRYGARVRDLVELAAHCPELGRPVRGAAGYLGAEVVYAATDEGALHLEDVLARRTRISIETWDGGVEAAPAVAALIAPVLGWNERRREQEVRTYLASVEAERNSNSQPDDASASLVLNAVPDVV